MSARVLFVQFAGDYRAAWERLRDAGGETYYGHAYVLDQLGRFADMAGAAGMLCALSPEAYEQELPGNVSLLGAAAHPHWRARQVLRMVAAWRPTHLVVLGPMPAILRWGLANRCRTLCVMADSFNTGPLRRWLRYGRLAALLNDPRIDWVANHGTNACRSLARIGVDPGKLVAWDWPQRRRPDAMPPRDLPEGEARLLYVGLVHKAKGVGDAIAAVAALRRRGVTARLEIAGEGDVAGFRALAARHGVADRVDFLGLVPNDQVFARMRAAHAVLVPSRHNYPEGLPLTIYESLCARTPIVASDHPMFAGHLRDGETAMIFPARDAERFADAITALLGDPALYRRLSERAQETWQGLQQPVLWGELIARWLSDSAADQAWIAAHALDR
jgi:glycosyltransferase involved in cell wall biosynthesis